MATNNYLVPSSKTSLLPALKAGNSAVVAKHLQAFKERGVVQHNKTLRIPSSERIPALTRTDEGYNTVLAILTMRLRSTFENFNLKRPLNEDQVINLAEKIIEESHEDNLSMEDVLLFLQQLEAGKMGTIFDRMDMPTFFELFEGYRQDRYLALRYLQYELETQHKSYGDPGRTSDGFVENDANTQQVMANYYKQQVTNNANQTSPVQQTPTP